MLWRHNGPMCKASNSCCYYLPQLVLRRKDTSVHWLQQRLEPQLLLYVGIWWSKIHRAHETVSHNPHVSYTSIKPHLIFDWMEIKSCVSLNLVSDKYSWKIHFSFLLIQVAFQTERWGKLKIALVPSLSSCNDATFLAFVFL